MQQLLSVFGVDWHLLIAQVVNFSIVLAALWYFLYTPVFKVLTERKNLIAKGIEDAARANEMLAGADGEAAKRIAAANAESEKMVSAARAAAQAEKVRLLKEAEERAATVAKDAEMRAQAELEKARRESEQEIARLAILAAEKVLKKRHD